MLYLAQIIIIKQTEYLMNQTAPLKDISAKINAAKNILIVVSDSPTVDALSAALGLTIFLNEMKKHATSIFSGKFPPAILFLEPERTFEANTDSLRDFIIALNKDKADHLIYKIEGDLVKIFITPYHTTITQDDLQFSLGDFNVELVITLGVSDQNHIDTALQAHGRILHDATVISLSANDQKGGLGSIDWHDQQASSLSEMVMAVVESVAGANPIDKNTATALLTGIVAETERFSNAHTTSQSMVIAAKLMASGADQQLIAAKLEEDHIIGPETVIPEPVKATVQPSGPTLSALENAVQGGLIVEHPEKTLEQLTHEIKTDDVREDVTYQTPAAPSVPAEPIVEPLAPSLETQVSLPQEPVTYSGQPVADFTPGGYIETNSNVIPTSGAMTDDEMDKSVDIFSQPSLSSSAEVSPSPSQQEQDALSAVHEALSNPTLESNPSTPPVPVTPIEPMPVVPEPTAPAVAPSEPSISLPMPPPLPDFSQVHLSTSPPLIIGSESAAGGSTDASQYKIPGQ